MAWYKHNSDGTLRTEDYKFTVKDLNDPELRVLRQVVANHNKQVRKDARRNQFGRGEYIANRLMRVRIMPRGARREHARKDYPGYGSFRSSAAYDSYLPMRYGTSFDVYVGRDTTAAYRMQRELQTGLTPGMQAKIDRLQGEIWDIQQQGRENLYG